MHGYRTQVVNSRNLEKLNGNGPSALMLIIQELGVISVKRIDLAQRGLTLGQPSIKCYMCTYMCVGMPTVTRINVPCFVACTRRGKWTLFLGDHLHHFLALGAYV